MKIKDAVLTMEKPQLELPAKSIEEILEKIGGFSWFQIWVTVVLITPEIPAAMITISPVLTGSTQLNFEVYSCEHEASAGNITETNPCGIISNCSRKVYTGQLYSSIAEEWGLYCDQAWMVDMVTSVQMTGSTIGALLLPRFADTYGRRRTFFSICLLMGTSGIAAYLAPNLLIFACLRFISGLTVGGMFVVYLNYLMEFLTPSYRTICGCVSFWAFGEMLLALMGYLLPSWRQLSVAVALPVLFVLLAIPWLPESPRWLLCKGRTDEAMKVFNKIAAWNGRPEISTVEVQFVQMEISKELSPGVHEKSEIKRKGCLTNYEFLAVFEANVYRPQFLSLIFIWFGVSLIYSGLNFNTKNLGGDPYLNILYLGICELPGSFSGLVLNNRFGRKRTLIGFLGSSTILLTLLVVLLTIPPEALSNTFGSNINAEGVTRVLALLSRYGNAAGFAILACLTAESFPTAARGTYAGTCGFFGNIGGILATQLVFLSTVWTSAPYIGFCCLSILVTITCFSLKETCGKPLCDSLPQTG